MTYKVIQVGVGSHGSSWCRHFLPPNIADGSIEVVAAVDTNPAVLKVAQDHTQSCLFSDGLKGL